MTRERRHDRNELLLYGASLALALALRMLALDRWPLLESEASLALSAWRFVHAQGGSLRWHSPFLFNVNALLFFLTDGSDTLARLTSLVFGSLLVLWPYGLRRHLGREGALLASFLLAASTSFVYFSWAVDGHIVVAFCALGLLVAVAGYLHDRAPQWAWLAAGLWMLALLSAPSAWTLSIAVLTLPLYLYLRARVSREPDALDRLSLMWNDVRNDRLARRGARVTSGVVFLVAGLAFLVNRAGLQMALDQLALWWQGDRTAAAFPWYRNLMVLGLYELLPLVIGLVGLYLDHEQQDILSVSVRHLLRIAFVFLLLPFNRPPANALLVLVPLALFSGRAFQHFWPDVVESARQPMLWVLVALAFVIAAAAYVQLAAYLVAPLPVHLLRIGALFVFVVAAHALLASLYGAQLPVRAAMVSVTLLLSLAFVRAEARINYRHARDPLEPLVGATTSSDLLTLERYAHKWSWNTRGDSRVMPFVVDDAVEEQVGWYLRLFDDVSYVPGVPSKPAGAAVIARASERISGYVGMPFRVREAWLGGSYSWTDWLRWLTERPGVLDKAAASDYVVLWLPAPASQQ